MVPLSTAAPGPLPCPSALELQLHLEDEDPSFSTCWKPHHYSPEQEPEKLEHVKQGTASRAPACGALGETWLRRRRGRAGPACPCVPCSPAGGPPPSLSAHSGPLRRARLPSHRPPSTQTPARSRMTGRGRFLADAPWFSSTVPGFALSRPHTGPFVPPGWSPISPTPQGTLYTTAPLFSELKSSFR